MLWHLIVEIVIGGLCGFAANKLMKGDTGSILKNVLLGVVKLAQHLGVVKYTENCGGSINLHSDNCALVLYTYRYKGLGGLDNRVDTELWESQMDRSWLYMLQSQR